MCERKRGEIYLTFDVEGPDSKEDFITPQTLSVLKSILRLLNKYKLRAIFFVTTSVLKEIKNYHEIIQMMEKHEIGYHGSTHSIKPLIFEYTDVEDYDNAVAISLERETSNIDLRTGETLDNNGGILFLREVFANKEIVAFRAPFLCWSPPHLEALKKLGIKFDFSTGIRNAPNTYKGITFYPPPIPVDSIPDNLFFNNYSISSIITRKTWKVLMMHPASFFYERHNNFDGGAQQRVCLDCNQRSLFYLRGRLALLELLFFGLRRLEQAGALEVTPPLKQATDRLNPADVNVKKIYSVSMWAARKFFHYEPKFLYDHFVKFFSGENNFSKKC